MRFGVFMYREALSESPDVVIVKEAGKKNHIFSISTAMHEPTKNEKRNGKNSSFPCINISASNSDLFQPPISFYSLH
jgi:hypothetical protein